MISAWFLYLLEITNKFSFTDPCAQMSYQILNDARRNVGYSGSSYCDSSNSRDWKGAGWYKMVAPAGTQIPEYVVDTSHCGTSAPGWLNGAHPTEIGVAVDRQVCFHWSSNSCKWSSDIKIMKCASYFLYYLPKTPTCTLGYCADNNTYTTTTPTTSTMITTTGGIYYL